MGRPRKSPDQQFKAWGLYSQSGRSLSAKAITLQLEQGFEEPVSQRTVERWLQHWKEQAVELDRPFLWAKMEDYGLPWESSAFLLTMWAFVNERGHIPDIPRSVDSTLPAGTTRQVRWWWRVHLAAPDMSLYDVYWLAQKFVFREQVEIVLGLPQPFDDLQALLAYRPWTSQSARERYQIAVHEGRISPVRGLVAGQGEEKDLAIAVKEAWSASEQPLIGFGGEMEGLLFSQILSVLVERGIREIHADVSDPNLFGALSSQHPTTPRFVQSDIKGSGG